MKMRVDVVVCAHIETGLLQSVQNIFRSIGRSWRVRLTTEDLIVQESTNSAENFLEAFQTAVFQWGVNFTHFHIKMQIQ